MKSSSKRKFIFFFKDFNDVEKHSTSGVLCLRDDIRVKMEEKVEEATQCRQQAREMLKQLACKYELIIEDSLHVSSIFRDEPMETNNSDDGLKKKRVPLNDIHQLKTRVKALGITFNEMNLIQVCFQEKKNLIFMIE